MCRPLCAVCGLHLDGPPTNTTTFRLPPAWVYLQAKTNSLEICNARYGELRLQRGGGIFDLGRQVQVVTGRDRAVDSGGCSNAG